MKKIIKICRQQCGGKQRNYFLAVLAVVVATAAVAWIANFGVVPLFLFAAFLLAPAFFIFLNLLLLVTHVLETIRPLLFSYNNELNIHGRRYNFDKFNSVHWMISRDHSVGFKPSFLPIFHLCVKEIAVIWTFIALLGASTTPIFAETNHIIAKGESLTLSLPTMKKFNIGNKEILKYRFDEAKKTLIMRGARIGHTELLIWNSQKENPEKHQVFVITKMQEAKYLHLAELLASLGLVTKLHLPHLQVSGELKTLTQYLQYKKIQQQNDILLLDSTHLELNLRNKIIGDIYKKFFNDYRESINCKATLSDIVCSYPVNEAPTESLKKFLSEKYRVQFFEQNNQRLNKNYSFKLRLIQLEQLDGEELRLGLDQLSASLGDLLKLPLQSVIEKNAVLLTMKKVRMNTLAEPQGLLRPMHPAEFQIGSDVPFVISNPVGTGAHTQWQFAGLKVKLTIENLGDMIKINYETELTQPSAGSSQQVSISGNKQKSSVVINLNNPTQIFQITLKTDANNVDQMPFLNRIPLLGELFKSKSSQNNYKMITGIIEVTEYDAHE